MATAIHLINLSARAAKILQHGQALDSNDQSDILDLLNYQLGGLVNKGADLGVSTPLAASDELYIDDDDLEALKDMLVKRIGNHYGRPIRQDVEVSALEAESLLLSKYIDLQEVEFDRSLVNRQYRAGKFV